MLVHLQIYLKINSKINTSIIIHSTFCKKKYSVQFIIYLALLY